MVGNYKVCIDEASAFLKVAKDCTENTADFLSGMMYPFAVNVSFSCELFLKGIMIARSSTDEFNRGHDLKDLFSQLNKQDQEAIARLYANKCCKSLDELLQESANAFENWRYALEKGVSICVSGMIAFADALQEYNKTIK